MEYQMTASIVIPTHNRRDLLCRTLDALCNQTALGSLKNVIVVSDGSTDSTFEIIEQFLNRLPIIYLERAKCGVASARNAGIDKVTSEIVILLDDDIVPSINFVAEHINFHRKMPGFEIALLGYVTWHPDLHVTAFMRWYGEYGALFAYSRLKEGRRIDARFLYSCNVSFKRSFLLAAGLFDETLTVLEDYELGYRLTQRGMHLFFCKAALGYHYQTFTFHQSCERLERYSSGVDSFLATSAGKCLLRKRQSFLFRSLERLVKMTAPILSLCLPVVDSDIKLPRFVYRALYWYYAAYLSFWARANTHLLDVD